MSIKIQEAYKTPYRTSPQKMSVCPIIIKLLNLQNKEKLLRAAKKKGQITYKGRPIRITADYSIETMKARMSWSDIIQTPKEHGCQYRLQYPAKLSITIDGINKIFHDKTRFKQYLSTNPALQKALERKLQPIDNTIEKCKEGKYTQATTKNNRK